jgi:hypothetical protein
MCHRNRKLYKNVRFAANSNDQVLTDVMHEDNMVAERARRNNECGFATRMLDTTVALMNAK